MKEKDVQRVVSRVFAKSKGVVSEIAGQICLEVPEGAPIAPCASAGVCYLVVDGHVAEGSCAVGAADDIVRFAGPGELLGLECLFAGTRTRRSRKLTAATAVVLMTIPRTKLEAAARREPVLMEELFRLMASVVEAVALRGSLLRGNNGLNRIRRLLEHFGWGDPPPIAWKWITRYLGMNGCAFSRSLGRLRRSCCL